MNKSTNRAKLMLGIVAGGLFISGITVWPAVPGLQFGQQILGRFGFEDSQLYSFSAQILASLQAVASDHPQILYGYDWLAFAHIVLAILFAGAIRDPVRNKWIIECGLIMCLLVPVLAATCIPLRQIPWFWFWIDFAFAPAAAVPLAIALCDVRRVEKASR